MKKKKNEMEDSTYLTATHRGELQQDDYVE
jgi:hypothetical protein